jgi:hypothetical protein
MLTILQHKNSSRNLQKIGTLYVYSCVLYKYQHVIVFHVNL